MACFEYILDGTLFTTDLLQLLLLVHSTLFQTNCRGIVLRFVVKPDILDYRHFKATVQSSAIGHTFSKNIKQSQLRMRRTRIQSTIEHVLVTGGSKGIGFHIAASFASRGTYSVSILARSEKDLEKAKEELLTRFPNVRISSFAADTTDPVSLKRALEEAEGEVGPIDILVCNAGLSIPKLCIDTTMEEYEIQAQVNYLGTVRTTKLVLPSMMDRGTGHIIFVSSVMGVLGFAGYSSYAPTKWAIRGFADCLHNELQGTGIGISVAYPPDTDTPGFEAENQHKSTLCKSVNDALGSKTFPPDIVGSRIVSMYEQGSYHLTPPDIGASMLISTMTSLSPRVFNIFLQIIVAPILVIVSSVLQGTMNRVSRRYNSKNHQKKVH